MNPNSQDRHQWVKKALIVTALTAATIVVLFLLWHLSQMLLVIFAGVMLAVLLDGISDWIGRHLRLPRPVTLPLVVILLLVFLAAAAWIVGPRIAEQFAKLTEKIPAALQSMQDWIAGSEWGRKLLADSPTTKDLLPVGSDLIGRVTGAFSSALGAVTSVLIIFFIGIYLAASSRQYTSNLVRLVPKSRRKRAQEVLVAVGQALRWWLAGRFASMVIIGILVAVGLWIVGIPLALTLGLIAAVLSFIPFIGPVLSAIPMILVALAEDPVLVIWALVVYLAVQTLESYLITPMIQKQAVFIPPALLITVQILMGVLFGVMGVLLATPLALVGIVVIQMLYIEDVLKDEVRIMGRH
jgi:predicted PurR-regulated permease PerM